MAVAYVHVFFFFFNDTATTEIYTLSLHDALPISRKPPPTFAPTRRSARSRLRCTWRSSARKACARWRSRTCPRRSEEHTSELQSQSNLVCRLLLEKKKKEQNIPQKPHSTINTPCV